MADSVPMTPECYARLQEELKTRIKVDRPKVVQGYCRGPLSWRPV